MRTMATTTMTMGTVFPRYVGSITLILFLLNLCITVRSSEMKSDSASSSSSPSSEFTCGLYVGESTIADAGLGAFVGVDREIGDAVDQGDICIPLIDLNKHQGGRIRPNNAFKDYYWNGFVIGMWFETAWDDIGGFCTGLGCVSNYHIPLINTHKAIPEHDYQNLNRWSDVGAGAFTPYHNAHTVASRYIPAGGEVFKDYGESWIDKRKAMKGIPRAKDYNATLQFLTAMAKNLPSSHTSEQEAYYNATKNMVTTESWISQHLRVMPDTLSEARQAVDAQDMGVIYQPDATRSLEWLQNSRNARCIDTIKEGPSTIPQAGRGAFARRAFRQGESVVTTPLQHLADSHTLDMYPRWMFAVDKKQALRLWLGLMYRQIHQWLGYPDWMVIGTQPIKNYCWGHEKSTLLLCPYTGLANLINHHATEPNVAVRWARDFRAGHHHDVVERWTWKEMGSTNKPKVSLEYVALRDIQPNEEIFVNYGAAWQQAWDEHVQNFEKESFVAHADYWNDLDHSENVMLRTRDEQVDEPYPKNVAMRCHYDLMHRDEEEEANAKADAVYEWDPRDPGEPCTIQERTSDQPAKAMYNVRMPNRDRKKRTWKTLTNVPRSAIRFFDEPYTTDIHLKAAFRHELRLPDELFPAQWCNLEETQQYSLGLIVIFLVLLQEFVSRWKRATATKTNNQKDSASAAQEESSTATTTANGISSSSTESSPGKDE